jgi:hypothetical protein
LTRTFFLEPEFSLVLMGFLHIYCIFSTHSKKPPRGGGYLSSKRTIRQVKIDAVQRALEQLAAPEADDSVEINEQMARFAALMKRAGD